VPLRTVFLDTSFIIALNNRSDPYHERAKMLDRELLNEGAVLLLHDGILLELGDGYSRLGRRNRGIEILTRFMTQAGYRIITLDDVVLRAAIEMYSQHRDKEWGLTDCVSFVLMRQAGILEALTADKHFQQAGFVALLLESEN
jgi:predicted nucleic acid-binding protein